MRAIRFLILSTFLVVIVSSVQAEVLAIKAGRILTVSQGEISPGILLIEDGKISEIGADVFIPRGTKTIDAQDKTVIPGLIDAHSSLFLKSSERRIAQGAPELSVLNAIDLFNDDYKEVLAQGVTAVCVTPHASSLWTCKTAVLKLQSGYSIDKLLVKSDVAVKASLTGAHVNRSTSLTRLGQYANLREAFITAKNYLKKWDKYEHDLAEYKQALKEEKEEKEDEEEKEISSKPLKRPTKPSKQPTHEVMADILRNKIPLCLEVHHADDIRHALRLAEEFKFRLILDQCTEGYLVADQIAKQKMAVIAGPFSTTLAPSPSLAFKHFSPRNPAILADQGIQCALSTCTGDGTGSRYLSTSAALAIAQGMDPHQALRAITLTPAEILGVADRIGSLDPGKDADIVICTGHPFSTTSHVDQVLIEGKLVYQRKATP